MSSQVRVDRDFLLQSLQDMIRINSVNPTLLPGAPGEKEIAHLIASLFTDMGIEVSLHESEPGRVSVVGRLRGSGGGRSLMLNGHIDTVDVENMDDPFSARFEDGRVYGRGSYDMKGGVAACVGALKAITDAGITPSGDILVAAVSDEEHSSIGTAELAKCYEVDGAIVAEPTELDVCVAHKGFIWYQVRTRGRAAHGSRYDLGVDANMHMGRFLSRLESLAAELTRKDRHALLGPPSLHAGTVRGGTGVSTYASECTLELERRTIPGEDDAEITAQISGIIDELSRNDERFDASLQTTLVRTPFEVSQQSAIVQAIGAASESVQDKAAVYSSQPVWMDAAILADAGADTVVMGASGAGAHASEEWVDFESVVTLSQIFALTALDYCK